MGRKSKQSRQVLAQKWALNKASAEQESSSSASDYILKDASLYDDEIMIVEGSFLRQNLATSFWFPSHVVYSM